MATSDPKADLRRYLQLARDAMLWKLEGLPEYQIRRPLVPTGTNLLGLVKHLAGVEFGYFGDTFGRPYPGPVPPGLTDPDTDNSDMFAAPGESRELITGLYREAWRTPTSPWMRWTWTRPGRCRGGRKIAAR